MATQKQDTFDQVDWDEISESTGFSLSIKAVGLLSTSAVVFAVFLYDFIFVGDREATFEAIGMQKNLTNLDYLFYFTLLVFFFYVVVPLYQHPRLTKYYWKEFKRNRPAVISLGWLGIVFVVGLIGPILMNEPEQAILESYQPPAFLAIDQAYTTQCLGEVSNGMCHGTWEYPLGTTNGGKGVFKMIIFGMGITLKIGFIGTFMAVTIGTLVGAVSAYAGGMVDEVLMRYVDIQQSFPTLLLFLLITYLYGATIFLLIMLFGIFSWGGMARYVRSKSLSISEEEYIQATKISGASSFRIIYRHVIPNSASSIITDITLLTPGFLLAEAQLSFLDLGDTSVASWGQLIAIGRSDLSFAPWIVLAPGFVLFLTILAFNFLGDALLDALNPEAEAEAEK